MSPRSSFEILSYDDPTQREKWRSICRSFKEIDIFFYPEYVYLFELKGDGKAHCFVYYDGDRGIVIYPFLIRAIKEASFLHDISPNFKDITSPYGHGGYLRNNEQVKMKSFFRKFHDFCDDNNIISEFIRFHPLLNNYSYSSAVEIREFSETIGIDLTGTADDIWKGIRPTSRNKIRKAQKHNIKIVKDEKYEKLSDFYEIYVNTMQRVDAQKYYYFSMQWFHDLVRLLPENVALFHSEYDGRIITSAIFLFTDNYIHYFLSGSVHELRNLGANNLLLYEVALWAKNRGIQFLHLGGGYKPNDPLFKFKASFSPVRKPYYIGKVVHNNVSYQYLLQKRRLMLGDQRTGEQFFPAYRSEVMGSIIIVGASGHARVCMDILLAQGRKIIGLYDDDPTLGKLEIHGYKVLGNIESFISSLKDNDDYIVAIGDNKQRRRISQIIMDKCRRPPINAIHPSAAISPKLNMGHGNFISPGVIINADTILGNYTIINTGATIDHDCVIQDYAQISPGCNIAGNVTIEEGAFLGTGAIVIPNKKVGAYAIVGAGAVVISDIPPYTTAVGVPARVIKQGYQQEVSKGVIIIGASGHALVCMDIFLLSGKKIIAFCDENPNITKKKVYDHPVIHDINKIIEELLGNDIDFFVGIGDNIDREKITLLINEKYHRNPLNAIHPSATISPQVKMGHGNFIGPKVVINIASHIGNHTIINTGATVGHENIIEDYAQIGPGCNLAGNVTIKRGAFLGAGTVVIPSKTVKEYAIIGAGSVVIHDIPPYSTAVGVPARVIKQHGKNREADL